MSRAKHLRADLFSDSSTGKGFSFKVALNIVRVFVFSLFLTPVHAKQISSAPNNVFDVSKKIEMVNWLKEHLTEVLERHLSQEVFLVNVSLSFDEQALARDLEPKTPTKANRALASSQRIDESDLLLDKLGVWAANLSADRDSEVDRNVSYPSSLEKYIQARIQLVFDQSLSSEKIGSMEEIVKDNVPLLAKSNVQVTSKQIEFRKATVTFLEKLEGFVFKFQNAVTVLIATIIFFLMLLAAMGRWSKVEKAKIEVMENQIAAEAARHEQAFSLAQEAEGSSEGQGPVDEGSLVEGENQLLGFEQFFSLLEADSSAAILFVRRWINSESEGAKHALVGISRKAGLDRLQILTGGLNESERKAWKSRLGTSAGQRALSIGSQFILSELVESTILPLIDIGKDLKELVAGLSVEESLACIERDKTIGPILLNLLPTLLVSRVLDSLEEETAREIVVEAVALAPEKVKLHTEALKAVVAEVRKDRSVVASPFADKCVDLIRDLGPANEDMLFDSLAELGSTRVLKKAASQFFPVELVSQLDQAFLKKILESFPVAKRAEIIFVVGDELRTVLMAGWGDGSKVMDMIKVEIEMIEGDEVRKEKLMKSSDEIIWTFVKKVRGGLSRDAQVASQAEALVDEWSQIKVKGGAGELPYAA